VASSRILSDFQQFLDCYGDALVENRRIVSQTADKVMPTQIESDKILLRDAFLKWFRVPEYQRPYVWGQDEVSDLLDDISNALQTNPNGQYFLGSIVFQRRQVQDSTGETYEELDLLDGQQRLTTCLLLHAVARELTNVPQLRDACHKSIFQEADAYSGVPERLRIVYDIRPEVRTFVETYIKPQGGTNDIAALKQEAEKGDDVSVRHMAAAILQIREHFEKHPNLLSEFFKFFRNNVLLIYVASAELEDAFRLFTVLNDRGMKLRNSDILKTKNLGALRDENAPDQEVKEAAKVWEGVENDLGQGFDTFLSLIRTVLVKEQARKTLLEEFEENVYKPKPPDTTPLLKPGREMFAVLKKYRSHYTEIRTGNNYSPNDGYTFDNLMTLLRTTSKADFWLPPLLFYREAFGTTDIVPFAKKLENKFMAGWVMRETPSTRSEAMNRILREMDRIKNDASLSDAQKLPAVLSLTGFNFDVDAVMQRLADVSVYGQPYATYILYKLDLIYGGKHTALQAPRYLSVEHVLPQNPAPNSLWKQQFMDQDRLDWTNRLGNLVLIGRHKNSALGRKDFAEKRNIYFQNHIQLFPNTLRVIQYPQWTLTELQQNHQKVIFDLRQWCQ
jgi:hypothetical protein